MSEVRRLTDKDKIFIRNAVSHQILALLQIPDPDDALELAQEIHALLTAQLETHRKACHDKAARVPGEPQGP